MQPYSQDLRERVLRALERGEEPVEVAERFEVSRAWVYRVQQRMREIGERCSFPLGGHRRTRLAEAEPLLRVWIAEQPDLTLRELHERLEQQGLASTKIGALWHQLNKWKLTFKKNAARQRARSCGGASGAPRVGRDAAVPGRRKTRVHR
jgi:transposase